MTMVPAVDELLGVIDSMAGLVYDHNRRFGFVNGCWATEISKGRFAPCSK